MSDILNIGALGLLRTEAGNLILDDGINSVSLPITPNVKNDIKFSLTSDSMSLTLNGATVEGSYTPVAQGLITLKQSAWLLTNEEP